MTDLTSHPRSSTPVLSVCTVYMPGRPAWPFPAYDQASTTHCPKMGDGDQQNRNVSSSPHVAEREGRGPPLVPALTPGFFTPLGLLAPLRKSKPALPRRRGMDLGGRGRPPVRPFTRCCALGPRLPPPDPTRTVVGTSTAPPCARGGGQGHGRPRPRHGHETPVAPRTVSRLFFRLDHV